MPGQIQFILNKDETRTDGPPATLVLDYLRRTKQLVGTKEGCKEGDCGACVVLIGELAGKEVYYKPITSCLMPVAELHGKHLVTIEGLNVTELTPVQQAIVDEGGTQCGFCTPGIVVSLTGYLLDAGHQADAEGLGSALGGNLCRCTGYASLRRAGLRLIKLTQTAESTNGAAQENLDFLIRKNIVPEYFKTIPKRLQNIPPPSAPNNRRKTDFIIAGGTDLYVQKGALLPDANVQVLNSSPELKHIKVENDTVHIGSMTTFEELSRDHQIRSVIPEIERYNFYNASWQIRNRATLGGNIINASPIGDMTALLLALDTDLILTNGDKKRFVAMKAFFKGYKVLDKKPGEILTEVRFPVPNGSKIHFEKISKRKTLDIASVNSAIKVNAVGGEILSINLVMGGVAPIPLFMAKTCAFLHGQKISAESVLEATHVAQSEISPISDIRGSAEYKRLLVRQLIIAHFTKLFPEVLSVRACYETH